MLLLTFVLVMIAVGVLVYLSQQAPWVHPVWKQIIYWGAIAGTIIWIGSLFGIWEHLNVIHIGSHK